VARVEVDRIWVVPADDVELVQEKVQVALRDHGLTADEGSAPEVLRFSGGSQAFRLLGGWLSPSRWFPRVAVVSVTQAADGVNVQLHAEEQMGVGVLDRRMRRKYEEVLEGLANTVRDGIGAQDADEPAAAANDTAD
jgi:hypothetical protein